MKIDSICICGAGTMGSGIAQVAAASGFSVLLFDVDPSVLAKAERLMKDRLHALVEKGRMTAHEEAGILGRIHFGNKAEECRADLVIEAIVEDLEVKVSLFKRLAEINTAEAIFATNTSSLSVSRIAAGVPRPERFIGMHFFNPAPVMKLVEVVRTENTLPDIVQVIGVVVQKMGKTPVVCKDSPGFIVNRVARPFYIESLRLVEDGIAAMEQVDTLLEATGFRMGPFRLMDLIGNDVNYAVSGSVYQQLGEPERLKPSPLQKEKVERGELGRKAGRGYYIYNRE